jgi:hypothetical protein
MQLFWDVGLCVEGRYYYQVTDLLDRMQLPRDARPAPDMGRSVLNIKILRLMEVVFTTASSKDTKYRGRCDWLARQIKIPIGFIILRDQCWNYQAFGSYSNYVNNNVCGAH